MRICRPRCSPSSPIAGSRSSRVPPKWADNLQHEGDVMDFYQSGDAAPSGRFNYVYREATP
jgi:hypothetical protein